MRICEIAHAKLNLALHVRGRRPDGFHDLDSVFVYCADGDELHFAPADALSLALSGPFAAGLSAGEDNLVLRAARALHHAWQRDEPARQEMDRRMAVPRGAAITLVKNLPPASGIGGGSADAAAALRALTALWDLPDDLDRLLAIAADLGSDVGPCLVSRPLHVAGRGDRFELLQDRAYLNWPVLLVNPGVPLATGPVFRGWDGVDRGALAEPSAFAAVVAHGRNDLAAPAIVQVPQIGDVLAALEAQAPKIARMSGSGATCFALFDTAAERDAAEAAIRASHPAWWLLATRLL
ncbi:MAG: 4-(cytidine 5'-diphospho)-2-C-methyl-D-erythritol kinase [Sphingomonadales bacterium]|nr:4-(cytidine 5'-diphospho)-2-C-methyl-D-erythritol kinase [Sphingomonadales bacterium]